MNSLNFPGTICGCAGTRTYTNGVCDACGGSECPSGWNHVDNSLPPCDSETVFIGINTAGYCCCFNEYGVMSTALGQISVCLYATPEGNDNMMDSLAWWKVLELPEPPK